MFVLSKKRQVCVREREQKVKQPKAKLKESNKVKQNSKKGQETDYELSKLCKMLTIRVFSILQPSGPAVYILLRLLISDPSIHPFISVSRIVCFIRHIIVSILLFG